MRPEIKWLALRYHRYVTSISGNRFVNWHVWHCIEMEWNVFGDQIKVNIEDSIEPLHQQPGIRLIVYNFCFVSSIITTGALLSNDCSSDECLCNRYITTSTNSKI